jgi:hypothetical protein
MNIKKLNTKYLLISSALLFIISISLKDKIKKYMIPTNKADFIKFLIPYAKTIGNKIGVPYVFLVSQIILETNWGKSTLFTKYNNVGGIKAKKGQNFVSLPTTEYINGVKVKVNQNFAVYKDLIEGLTNYALIFQNKYFKQYLNKTTDPDKFVSLLQSGVTKYATDINYITKIQSLNKEVQKYA